ncbi:MAG: helix-turn-helix transcriptional regulator [Candidatus Woesearchaeota archaeon]
MKQKTFTSITIGFAALTITLLGLVWFLVYLHQAHTPANPVYYWLIQNRLPFTIATMILSAVAGYALATYTNIKLADTQAKTQEVIELLKQFLSEEEQTIINYLIENNNKALQAELSRIEGLSRVKVHRTLNKLKEQKLITITKHGKTNKIQLSETVAKILR